MHYAFFEKRVIPEFTDRSRNIYPLSVPMLEHAALKWCAGVMAGRVMSIIIKSEALYIRYYPELAQTVVHGMSRAVIHKISLQSGSRIWQYGSR